MTPLLAWLNKQAEYVIVIGWASEERKDYAIVVHALGNISVEEIWNVKIIGPAEQGWHTRHGASSFYGFRSDL